MKKIIILAAIITAALIAVTLNSCSKKSLDGVPVDNIAPIINWSNIPLPDSVFHSNGILSWYGRDIDGRVVRYYYLVEVADSIHNDPAGFVDSLLPSDSTWYQTDQTRVDVSLIAAPTEGDTLTQYVFVKCQDNNGAFSPVIYRRFMRVNNFPETNILSFPGITVDQFGDTTRESEIWCLPDTNAIWNGLRITWEGKDTLDFPINPPPFTFQVRLYGPYDTSLYASLTLADTLNSSYMYMYDPESGEPWVYAQAARLTDLRTGAYLFSVRTRDDALAPDPIPAWNKFRCVEPVWISNPSEVNDVLVIQATQFNNGSGTTPSIFYRNNPPSFPDSVTAFYNSMITTAGYNCAIYGTAPVAGSFCQTPPVNVLANYRMVIVDNMDFNKIDLKSQNGNEEVLAAAMRKYLSIGGKVWVIGRLAFGPGSGGIVGWDPFGNASLPYQFFDLEGGTYSRYTTSPVAEFIGANSLSPEFANLRVDSTKCSYLNQINITKVESIARVTGNSFSLYTYDAINPDTSIVHGLPVAVRYEPTNQVYKSSYFAIPLYLMDNSSGKVQDVFDVMLGWFLQ